MLTFIKKQKSIVLSVVVIVVAVGSPFMFEMESCDDRMGEVERSMNDNTSYSENSFVVQENPYGISLTTEELQGLLQLQKTHRISQQDAEKMALEVAQDMDVYRKSTKARTSESGRKISNVSTTYYYNGAKTNARVADNDPNGFPLYVFNYSTAEKDSAGFSLIAGDERIPYPVLFEAEEGFYDGESTQNKEFEFVAKIMPVYVKNTIEKVNRTRDSLLLISIEKIYAKLPDDLKIKLQSNANSREQVSCPPYCNYNAPDGSYTRITNEVITKTTVSEVAPLIKLKWGQCSPYNNNVGGSCSNRCNNKYYTGCVATAIAMIAAYWERPTTYNWSIMKYQEIANNLTTDGKAEVARLLYDVGRAEDIEYGCSASGAGAHLTFLRQNGYIIPTPTVVSDDPRGDRSSYSESSVISSLDNRRPLLITGLTSNYSAGHAWILSGYKKQANKRSFTLTTYSSDGTVLYRSNMSFTDYVTKIHCNWGWDGLYNGYIVNNVFDTSVAASDRDGNARINYVFSTTIGINADIHP